MEDRGNMPKEQTPPNSGRRTPPGVGIVIGIIIGAAIGIALDNIGMGIAVGVAIGVAMESAYQGGKPTEDIHTKKVQKVLLITGVLTLMAGLGVFFFGSK